MSEEEDIGDTGNPADYFFHIMSPASQSMENMTLVAITPRKYFRETGYLLDTDLAIDELLERNGFYQTVDSIYETYDLSANARTKLVNLGLVEHMLFDKLFKEI